jgi:hypothetical protein
VCKSGLIPSPKAQEGQCKVSRREKVYARAEVEFHFQRSGETMFQEMQMRPKVIGLTEGRSEAKTFDTLEIFQIREENES